MKSLDMVASLDSESPISHFHDIWLNEQMMLFDKGECRTWLSGTQAGFQLLLSGFFLCKVQPVQQYVASLHFLPNTRPRKMSEKIEKAEIKK